MSGTTSGSLGMTTTTIVTRTTIMTLMAASIPTFRMKTTRTSDDWGAMQTFIDLVRRVDARIERVLDALDADHPVARDLRLAAGDLRRVALGLDLGLDAPPSREILSECLCSRMRI